MRKRSKYKRGTCGLCNPHKKGGKRWKDKELAELKEFEKIKQSGIIE